MSGANMPCLATSVCDDDLHICTRSCHLAHATARCYGASKPDVLPFCTPECAQFHADVNDHDAYCDVVEHSDIRLYPIHDEAEQCMLKTREIVDRVESLGRDLVLHRNIFTKLMNDWPTARSMFFNCWDDIYHEIPDLRIMGIFDDLYHRLRKGAP